MKKNIFLSAIIALLLIQCGKDNNQFLIKKGAIGELTKQMDMRQVDSLFAQDSIVKIDPKKNALGMPGDVEIYEKGGAKLLLISPVSANDPASTIGNIQIFDDRYLTEKNLSKNSNFKYVKENYTIAGIQSTRYSVQVSLQESDVYLIIDKNQLPENLRYDPSITIEASHIPDNTTFKYFMIDWQQE